MLTLFTVLFAAAAVGLLAAAGWCYRTARQLQSRLRAQPAESQPAIVQPVSHDATVAMLSLPDLAELGDWVESPAPESDPAPRPTDDLAPQIKTRFKYMWANLFLATVAVAFGLLINLVR
jgi:hypothetical protein